MSVELARGIEKGKILGEVISRSRLGIGNIEFVGDGNPVLNVPDLNCDESDKIRKGISYFAKFESHVAEAMRGSALDATTFLTSLDANNIFITENASLLMSSEIGNEEVPKVSVESEDQSFRLNVFHGSRNKHAVRISELANDAQRNPKSEFSDVEVRAEYQNEIAQVVKPVFSYEEKDHADVRIIEDCIASGDTIVGGLSLLAKKGKLLEGQRVRIDVAVATTQGILLLKEFARQNNLFLEINAGYLAYGLSEGEIQIPPEGGDSVPIHANYLVYPKSIKEFTDFPDYVVADMGNGLQSLPDVYDAVYSWNKHRGMENDAHGKHSHHPDQSINSPSYDPDKTLLLVFANGGYGMHAFHKWTREDEGDYSDIAQDYNVWVMRASRVWSHDPKFGFGVAFKDLPKELQ